MGKHLERLGGYSDRHEGRIFTINKRPDGQFEIREACDQYFAEVFSSEELRELAAEIVDVSHS